MSDYHEPAESLTAELRDAHRALASLKEEIEAVDWYHQRIALCGDDELRRILTHNRDEEIEHACMALAWLRRRMPEWDVALRRYVSGGGASLEAEEIASQQRRPSPAAADLGIGSFKHQRAGRE